VRAVTFAWAVLTPPEWGFVEVDIYSVSGTRAGSMARFVADWRHGGHDGLTTSKVWQRAYRKGWRLARVSITPALGYSK
jgi:hypothetical protein